MNTLVIDNGGDSIKIGTAPTTPEEIKQLNDTQPHIIPNLIAKHKSKNVTTGGNKFYIGDQLQLDCPSYASLLYRRPIERGYITDCETQSIIWENIFNKYFTNIPINESRIMLTHQPFTPPTLQKDTCQLIFEYFGFKEYSSLSSQYCSFYGYLNELQLNQLTQPNHPIVETESCLIIDSGFSFTHIVPILNKLPVKEAIQRIDIGGKALTNYLKELVSLRYYDMMEETYLMNIVKERLCYVSNDFMSELKSAECLDSPLFKDYVLPDYKHSKTGYVLENNNNNVNEDIQILRLNNERISVPELLFHPSDIGLNQSGIIETAGRMISSKVLFQSPVEQAILFDSILLTGGNTKFKGFAERVQKEMRTYTPQEFNSVRVHTSKDPITLSWRGAAAFVAQQEKLLKENYTVTKEEYEEIGFEICQDKFTI